MARATRFKTGKPSLSGSATCSLVAWLATVLLTPSPLMANVDNVRLNPPFGSDQHVLSFRVRPDSQQVLYRAIEGADNVRHLYTVPIAGGLATKLNTNPVPGAFGVQQSVASPDSNWVVYRADQDTVGIDELYLLPSAGGAPTKINPPVTIGVGSPVFSPDSNWVIFTADGDLYTRPVAGGTATRLNPPLVADGFVSGFSISSDGAWVVYRADQDIRDVHELFSVPIAGGPVTRLNPPLGPDRRTAAFLISPDSSRVVYAADQEADDVRQLYSVPVSGGTATRLNGDLVAGGDVVGTIPSFRITPDSSRVAYIADQDRDEVRELYSVAIAGGVPTKLNEDFADSFRDVNNVIRISPDGSRVVYTADQEVDGRVELYQAPVDGGPSVKLNGDLVPGGGVRFFGISSDSTRVVYEADGDISGVIELYSAPLDGGPSTKLNTDFGPGQEIVAFAISPTGNRVAYRAIRDSLDALELYTVPIIGGTVTRLNGPLVDGGSVTGIPGFDEPVRISPDGRRVIYRADQHTNDVFELYSSLLVPDSDGDEISDDADPDTVATAVEALPLGVFDNLGDPEGQRNAFLSRLEDVQRAIERGDIEEALSMLRNLLRTIDGCPDTPEPLERADMNDWITDCDAQRHVRLLVEFLIMNLMMML